MNTVFNVIDLTSMTEFNTLRNSNFVQDMYAILHCLVSMDLWTTLCAIVLINIMNIKRHLSKKNLMHEVIRISKKQTMQWPKKDKVQTMIYKILHRKLTIEQNYQIQKSLTLLKGRLSAKAKDRLSAKAVVGIFMWILFSSPRYVVCLQTFLYVVGILDGNICFTCIFDRVFWVVFSWKDCCGHSHMLVGVISTYAIGA